MASMRSCNMEGTEGAPVLECRAPVGILHCGHHQAIATVGQTPRLNGILGQLVRYQEDAKTVHFTETRRVHDPSMPRNVPSPSGFPRENEQIHWQLTIGTLKAVRLSVEWCASVPGRDCGLKYRQRRGRIGLTAPSLELSLSLSVNARVAAVTLLLSLFLPQQRERQRAEGHSTSSIAASSMPIEAGLSTP